MELLPRACKPRQQGYFVTVMLLAAPDTSSQYAFDAAKDNTAMVLMGAIVLVTWLLFRVMIELSKRKKKDEPPKP